MARTVTKPDTGRFNIPATIQAPAAWSDNGQGGNAAHGQWVTVRSPMIALHIGQAGKGASLSFKYGQLYPTANGWAEMRYSSTDINATMSILIAGRRYRILGAIDVDMRHQITVLPLQEEQAKGST